MSHNQKHRHTQHSSQKNYSGTNELWANERNLKNYNHHIVSKFSKPLQAGSKVLEFGAGIGTLASIFRENYHAIPDCIEVDPDLRGVLAERNFLAYEDLQSSKKSYDLIYTSNVLEHIHNDLEALNSLHKALNHSGTLMIYVPAFMFLYSPADAAIGHYRRYSKRDLINKLHSANFSIQICEYSDSIGFFAWFLTKFSKESSQNKIASEASLELYDRLIFPISRLLDRFGFKYLFGKNIFIQATKN